jgi:hypothetical protein
MDFCRVQLRVSKLIQFFDAAVVNLPQALNSAGSLQTPPVTSGAENGRSELGHWHPATQASQLNSGR